MAAGLLALSVACCGWLVVCVSLEMLFGAETILAVALAVALGSGFVPWAAVTPIENRENMVSGRVGRAGGHG